MLFAAWDAEEKGLLGSKHWAAHPTVPLNHVVAGLNMDMIGRLRDDHLIVFGSRSGYGWRRLLSCQNDGLGLAPGVFLEAETQRRPLSVVRPRHSRGDVTRGSTRTTIDLATAQTRQRPGHECA